MQGTCYSLDPSAFDARVMHDGHYKELISLHHDDSVTERSLQSRVMKLALKVVRCVSGGDGVGRAVYIASPLLDS
jgi:hypothetical protein